MAWIYSAELEDSPWDSPSGSDQSRIVITIPTAKLSYCNECGRVIWLELQSGMTLRPYRPKCCRKSISSTAASPARTSALRAMAKAWKESEAGYFLKSQDWLGSFDPPLFSWRTCQQSLFEDLREFLWSSLRSGTTVGGRLFQPKKLEPAISENDGSYLPTPTATEGGYNQGGGMGRCGAIRPTLATIAKTLPTPMARDWKGAGGKNRKSQDLPRTMGGSLNPQFVEELMGFPIGWTGLEPWAMLWCRSRRKELSEKSFQKG